MASTTFTERVGLGERMVEHLEENSKALEKRGLNVDYWVAALRSALDAVVAADHRQEALKAELKATTATVNAADREAYVLVSGAIDAVAAAWGKDSEQGEIVLRMRSKLHRPDGEAVPLPVETPAS